MAKPNTSHAAPRGSAEVNWASLLSGTLSPSPMPRLYGCPPKLKTEATSSWIYRIAASYRWSPVAISRLMVGSTNSATLDFGISKDKMRQIATVAVCSATLLTSRLERGVSVLNKYYRDRLINNIQGRPRVGFCPICLSEDDVPYIRSHWRLATTIFCDRHNVLLTDRCPSCSYRINLIGRENVIVPDSGPADALRFCPACLSPWRTAYSPPKVPARTLPMVTHFQYLAIELLERGSTRDPAFRAFERSDFFAMFLARGQPPSRYTRIDWHRVIHPRDHELLLRWFRRNLDA